VFGELAGLSYATSPLAACDGADALVIVTEWKEFRSADFDALKARLKSPLIFDGRNLYDPPQLKAAGFEYAAIGRR
jgi:UDPglucose 6-dehydrogenase